MFTDFFFLLTIGNAAVDKALPFRQQNVGSLFDGITLQLIFYFLYLAGKHMGHKYGLVLIIICCSCYTSCEHIKEHILID